MNTDCEDDKPDRSETILIPLDRTTVQPFQKNGCETGNAGNQNYYVPFDKKPQPLINAIKNGNVVLAKEYIINGTADVEATVANGSNALHFAAQYKQLELVELLVSRVKDIDAQNKKLKTALMYATERGNLEIVKVLLDNDANETIVDGDKNTLLHFAAQIGNLEVIKIFAERKNIPINSTNSFNTTAKQIADYRGITANVKYLQSKGAV